MASEENQSDSQSGPTFPIPPREQMISTAVSFLQNPRVRTSPLSQQKAFLSKKGLTDEEINLAIERAEVPTSEVVPHSMQPLIPANNAAKVHHPSVWTQMYKTGSTFVVMGVAVYGLHQFYKSYVEPWLYGSEKKDNLAKLKEQLSEVQMSLSELQQSVTAMEKSINSPKTEQGSGMKDLDPEHLFNPIAFMEMRSDVATIKSLLLNRNQFPDVPKIYASIPSWQLPLNASENSDETTPKIKSKDIENSSEKVEDDSGIHNGDIVNNDDEDDGNAVVNGDSSHAIDLRVEGQVQDSGESQEMSPVEASTPDAPSVQTSTSSDFSIISSDVKSS